MNDLLQCHDEQSEPFRGQVSEGYWVAKGLDLIIYGTDQWLGLAIGLALRLGLELQALG